MLVAYFRFYPFGDVLRCWQRLTFETPVVSTGSVADSQVPNCDDSNWTAYLIIFHQIVSGAPLLLLLHAVLYISMYIYIYIYIHIYMYIYIYIHTYIYIYTYAHIAVKCYLRWSPGFLQVPLWRHILFTSRGTGALGGLAGEVGSPWENPVGKQGVQHIDSIREQIWHDVDFVEKNRDFTNRQEFSRIKGWFPESKPGAHRFWKQPQPFMNNRVYVRSSKHGVITGSECTGVPNTEV